MDRKRITQRAIIALLVIILIMLGVTYDNDECTQRRDKTDAQGTEALQPEQLQGQAGSFRYGAGFNGYKKGIEGFEFFMQGATGGDRQIDPCGLPKYTDHEGEQTEGRLTLFSIWGDAGRTPGDSGDADPYDGAVSFKVTQYTAGYESTGKRPGDPAYGITYSGERVKENHTIAADPDVLPIGTKVQIEGLDGIYVVEDTGSKVNGKHIDIYTEDLEDAQEWGVQKRRVILLCKEEE